ncbi:MAG: hypothetical protein AVDCRST_MAG36-925, partial [uncultured Nocardioidaceae bacterium]
DPGCRPARPPRWPRCPRAPQRARDAAHRVDQRCRRPGPHLLAARGRPHRLPVRAAAAAGGAAARCLGVRRGAGLRGPADALVALPRGVPRAHGPAGGTRCRVDHAALHRRRHRDRRRAGDPGAGGADLRCRPAQLARPRRGRAGAVHGDPRRRPRPRRHLAGLVEPRHRRAEPAAGHPARRRAGAAGRGVAGRRRPAPRDGRRRVDRSRRRGPDAVLPGAAAVRRPPRLPDRLGLRDHHRLVPVDRGVRRHRQRPAARPAPAPAGPPTGAPDADRAGRPARRRGGTSSPAGRRRLDRHRRRDGTPGRAGQRDRGGGHAGGPPALGHRRRGEQDDRARAHPPRGHRGRGAGAGDAARALHGVPAARARRLRLRRPHHRGRRRGVQRRARQPPHAARDRV